MFGGWDGTNPKMMSTNLTSYSGQNEQQVQNPARFGHSSILYDREMVMFGGWDMTNRKRRLDTKFGSTTGHNEQQVQQNLVRADFFLRSLQ